MVNLPHDPRWQGMSYMGHPQSTQVPVDRATLQHCIWS